MVANMATLLEGDEEISYFGGVEEYGHQFGVWKGGNFLALSNFKIDFCSEVRAQREKKSAKKDEPCGYICDITYRDGRALGRTFVSSKDCEDRVKLPASLRSSLGCPSLHCNANNTQLGAYMMTKLEKNIREGDVTEKLAANCTGLQKSKHDSIWVLNEDVQIDSKGTFISPDASPYVWVSNCNFIDEDLASSAQVTSKRKKYVRNLVSSLEECYEHNTPAALLTLGAELLCLHYEALNLEAKIPVPATVLVGQINLGKSKATAAALSLLGVHKCNFLSSITDSRSRKMTMKTTLGFVIDDPTDPSEIADKILYHFDMGKSSNERGTYTPRCTFITSINDEALQKLSSMPSRYITRVVLIPFLEGSSTMTPVDRRKADMKLSAAIDCASNGASLVVSLGKKLVEEGSELDEVMEKVTDMIPQTASHKPKQRIYTSYSLLIFVTLKLLEKVKQRKKFESAIWQFFQQQIVPLIEKHQVRSGDSRRKQFEDLLLKAVDGQTPQVVKSFLRVESTRGSDEPSAVSILVPHLEQHLRSSKVVFNRDILTSIAKFYPGMSRGSVLRTFLTAGSPLEDIPKGSKGRRNSGTVYLRCVEIDATALESATLQALVKAFQGEEQTIANQTPELVAEGGSTEVTEMEEDMSDLDHSSIFDAAEASVSHASREHLGNGGVKRLGELARDSFIHWKPKPRQLSSLPPGVRAASLSPLKRLRTNHPRVRCVSVSPSKLLTRTVKKATVTVAANALRALTMPSVKDTIIHRSQFPKHPKRIRRSTRLRKPQEQPRLVIEDEEHCQSCGKKDRKGSLYQWVGCEAEGCWRWWHFGCVGLSQLPSEDQTWLCPVCAPPSGCLT